MVLLDLRQNSVGYAPWDRRSETLLDPWFYRAGETLPGGDTLHFDAVYCPEAAGGVG